MKQSIFEIIENTALTSNVYRMRLTGDTSAITAPGQFVNIKLDGKFLRRPISVCDCKDGVLTGVGYYGILTQGKPLGKIKGFHTLPQGGNVAAFCGNAQNVLEFLQFFLEKIS